MPTFGGLDALLVLLVVLLVIRYVGTENDPVEDWRRLWRRLRRGGGRREK